MVKVGAPSRHFRFLAALLVAGLYWQYPISLGLAGGNEPSIPVKPGQARFVGSDRCVACHHSAYSEWKGSQHHASMQEARDTTVLGDFNGATLLKDGVKSTFFKKDDKFWVHTDGPDGKLSDFLIRYTFGISPLQQYLIELPGGRLQALGIAWDARSKDDGGQRWYHLYPDQTLKPGDPLHWTGIEQNWNFQCAWCHSTNLQKHYDAGKKSFQTTWSEISVGCEACHGPASDHVAWAAATDKVQGTSKGFTRNSDERRGTIWVMGPDGQARRSAPRAGATEIESCAGCHAHRQQFSSDPQAVRSLFDSFRPTNIEPGHYHPDGQQRGEVFTYGSFVQSKMHAAGVTCSDCHNPHSGKLRQSGNGTCAQCHAREKYDTPDHHHHSAGSKGSECVSCHMPTKNYMGVDARHDHSMRIPRPDRSIVLGTPNACNGCHASQPASWARDAIKTWLPSPKPGAQDFAEAFDLGDRRAPGAQRALLAVAGSGSSSTIARASAFARLANFPTPEALALAKHALTTDAPAVRAAAISVIAGTDAATRRSLLVPLLRDASRLVRMDAARALAGAAEIEILGDDRKAFHAALEEYEVGQLFNAERPESHANLGSLYIDRGKPDQAREAFRRALDIDPRFVAAAVALADIERSAGNESAAEAGLRDALKMNPRSGTVQHALALSLIRQRRMADAMSLLSQAAENEPGNPRFGYVLAVAMHDIGRLSEAIQILRGALLSHPYDREILLALASYEVEAKDIPAALERVKLLRELEPDRQDIARLLAQLLRRAR